MSDNAPSSRRRIAARVVTATLYAVGAVVLGTLSVTLFWPARVPSFAAVRAAYVPSDAWLLDRHGTVIASRRIRYDVRRLAWVPLGEVSPALVSAIVEGEDRHFWRHHGVDWRSVAGAVRDGLVRRQRRGASTVTMQLATLLRGRRADRGLGEWPEKLEQVRVALALERSWTKPEILEAYLNLLGYKGSFRESVRRRTSSPVKRRPVCRSRKAPCWQRCCPIPAPLRKE